MIHPPQSFTITDPREYDGTPYEAAERAVRQAEAVAQILRFTVASARLMARNAQMERDLALTGECDAVAYDASAEGRRFDTVAEYAEACENMLKPLARAVAFDPKAPLGG